MKKFIDPLFEIGQIVFRKTDAEKSKYIVINYVVDHKDLLYTIAGTDGTHVVYSFEISDYLSVVN